MAEEADARAAPAASVLLPARRSRARGAHGLAPTTSDAEAYELTETPEAPTWEAPGFDPLTWGEYAWITSSTLATVALITLGLCLTLRARPSAHAP